VDKERSEAEFNFARGPITFNGEYIWGRDGGVHKSGSYTQFAYRFTKPLEGVFRFEDFEPNTRIGNNESKFYLFGLNWYLHTNLKFQFNYETRDDVARTKLGHTFLTQATLQF
jgi:phosphate-selective porin